MARVHEQAAQDAVVAKAVAYYQKEDDTPPAFRSLLPEVLAEARRISGGDWRRCTVDKGDSAIVVHNFPVWQLKSNR